MSTPMSAYGNRTPEQLKVAELRDELRKRGVQIKGLKKELVDRLEELLRHEEEQQQQELVQQQQESQSEEVGVGFEQGLEVGATGCPEPMTPILKQTVVDAEPEAGAVVELVAVAVGGELPDLVTALENEAVAVGNAIAEQPNEDAENVERVVVDAKEAEPTAEEELEQEENGGLPEVVQTAVTSAILVTEPEAALVEKEKDVMESQPLATAAAEEEEEVFVEPVVAPAEEVVADAAARETASDLLVEAAGEAVVKPAVVEPAAEEKKAASEGVVEPASGPVIAALDEDEEEEEVVTPPDEEVVAPMEEDVVVVTEVLTEESEVTTEVVVTQEITVTTECLVETPGEEKDGEEEEEEEVVDKSVVMQMGSREEEAMEVVEDAIETTAAEEKIVREEEVSVEEIREFQPDTEMKTETVVAEMSPEVQHESEMKRQETPKAEDYDDELRKLKDVKNVEIDTETQKYVKTMEIDIETQTRLKRKEGDGEVRSQEPTKRQRRWNTGKSDIDVKAAPPKVLTTDSVKEETPSEVKETAPSFAALPPTVPVPSSTPKSASGLERTAITRPAPSRTEASFNGETQKTRVVPPSTKPATTSLKIDKFLRPFTHKAVKELLANTGVVGAMWMDQIKTHCYVTYSTVEEAVATRNALYNLQWPPQGGRLLTVEFVEPEEVKIRCDGEKAATSNTAPPRGPVPAHETPAEHVVSAPPPTQAPSLPPSVPASGLPPPPPLPPHHRERPSMPSKQEMESQGPTLDDLFKKTRAKPHIYYLPLTEKDVAEKLAARHQKSMVKPGVKT